MVNIHFYRSCHFFPRKSLLFLIFFNWFFFLSHNLDAHFWITIQYSDFFHKIHDVLSVFQHLAWAELKASLLRWKFISGHCDTLPLVALLHEYKALFKNRMVVRLSCSSTMHFSGESLIRSLKRGLELLPMPWCVQRESDDWDMSSAGLQRLLQVSYTHSLSVLLFHISCFSLVGVFVLIVYIMED